MYCAVVHIVLIISLANRKHIESDNIDGTGDPPSYVATSTDWLSSAPPMLQKYFVLLLGTGAQSKRHLP